MAMIFEGQGKELDEFVAADGEAVGRGYLCATRDGKLWRAERMVDVGGLIRVHLRGADNETGVFMSKNVLGFPP